MPLTGKGEEIKSALTKEYGAEKGEQVLYAGKNKGTFTGIDCDKIGRIADAVNNLQQRFDAIVDAVSADPAKIKAGTIKQAHQMLLSRHPSEDESYLKGLAEKAWSTSGSIEDIFRKANREVRPNPGSVKRA